MAGHMNFSIKKIAEWLNDSSCSNDLHCHSISIDSRNIQPGALFIAIIGENFDGHDFVKQAEQKGAAAIIVDREVQTSLPMIQVKDTRKALGEIAKKWREQWNHPVIAVTGSCGKTTTKTMIAHILQQPNELITHPDLVLASEGTLNNDIGLPLTILKLTPSHQFAVFELGANHLGEIAYLTDIAKPTVSVITNVGGAHLEGFGSMEGVAKEKSEIYRGLKQDGIAVLNVDDDYSNFWREIIDNRKILTFSMHDKADVYAKDIHLDRDGHAEFILVTPQDEVAIHLPFIGKHHVSNALAAVAACLAAYSQAGITVDLKNIKKGLESLSPINKRLVAKKTANGIKILDDSYNANPLSLRAALEVLAYYSGKKVLVLGDMSELGLKAEEYHKDAAYQAKKLGIDAIYAVGELSRFAVEAFGNNAYHFENKQKLISAIQKNFKENMVILVKGSRSAKMEEVVAALVEG